MNIEEIKSRISTFELHIKHGSGINEFAAREYVQLKKLLEDWEKKHAPKKVEEKPVVAEKLDKEEPKKPAPKTKATPKKAVKKPAKKSAKKPAKKSAKKK